MVVIGRSSLFWFCLFVADFLTSKSALVFDPVCLHPKNAKNALDCRDIYDLKIFFGGNTPGSPWCLDLDLDTNFRLALQRFHCFCIMKQQLLLFQTSQTEYALTHD